MAGCPVVGLTPDVASPPGVRRNVLFPLTDDVASSWAIWTSLPTSTRVA